MYESGDNQATGKKRIKFMKNAIQQILELPCSSFWLKNALKTALDRDSLDALRDAETLVKLLKGRV